ncbi:hypothetical protein [Marinomonas atlantica]|uniref:hypothetical protein n=1 Tax=Marinomonas atlantica TaxID=1806668 RepID=UPI000829CB24|nr:hypothetical protein [Marinomonas atlantica]
MNVTTSTHTAFDRRRMRFSDWIVQYAVLFILLFSALLVGTYFSASERLQESQRSSNELYDITYQTLELMTRWQAISEDQGSAYIPELLQWERSLGQRLRQNSSVILSLPSAPVTISQFTIAEQIQLALNRLSQIKQIAAERNSRIGDMDLFHHPYVMLLSLGWFLLLIYLIWGWRRILLDRRVALSFFHSQIDRAQSGSSVSVPVLRSDEFGDFARYLDSFLNGVNSDLLAQKALAQLYQAAMSSSLSLKLLVNEGGEILSVSEGMSALWILESESLSDFLGVDIHLSSLEGEQLSSALIAKNTITSQRIGKKNYELRCTEIMTCKEQGYLVELVQLESHAELRVLEATLSLMANDVWDAPVRILDDTSPYFSFSNKLEANRKQVFDFLTRSNVLVNNCDKEYPKITKLQQLFEWLIAKLNSNEVEMNESLDSQNILASDIEVSKQDFLLVREQIEYRFELYEAYIQQLAGWQASQNTWVAVVNEGLVNTKEAILNLLSIVHTEPSSASVIEHSVIDLSHDIDTVLTEILNSKPAPGDLKLEHIKSTESDLMRRLNDVQSKLDHVSDLVNKQKLLSH